MEDTAGKQLNFGFLAVSATGSHGSFRLKLLSKPGEEVRERKTHTTISASQASSRKEARAGKIIVFI